MAALTAVRKPLMLRATPEQHQLLKEAAAKQHRSLNSFVLSAALDAAGTVPAKPRRTREEIQEIVRAAREAVRAANPTNRDLVAELLAERRAEAASE